MNLENVPFYSRQFFESHSHGYRFEAGIISGSILIASLLAELAARVIPVQENEFENLRSCSMDNIDGIQPPASKGLYWRITFLNLILILSVACTVYVMVGMLGMNPWNNILQPLYIATVIAYTQFTITLFSLLRVPAWQSYLFTCIVGVIISVTLVTVSWLLL